MIRRALLTGLVIVVLAAGGLALTGQRTFQVEIVIPVPPEAVWAVLTDTPAYGEWNPVFVAVEGRLEEGAQTRNSVRDPSGALLQITSDVVRVVPNREINQFGGTIGLITFDHTWRLEPVPEGTRVIQHEIDRGIGMWFWDSDWIEPAYRRVNEALRERVKVKQAS